jgi:branched-subunit amino acid transport protein
VTAWLVILAVGAGTYGYRAVMFALLGNRRLPAWTDRPLALVGPAAIGALVGGMLLTDHGTFDPAGWVELVAVVAAFVAVRRTGDVFHGLITGFALLWMLGAIGR